MERHLYIVHLNAEPGQDWELKKFYADQHLREAASIPGFVSAELYEISATQKPGVITPGHRYLALYAIQGPVDQALHALSTTSFTGTGSIRSDAESYFYDAVGDAVVSDRQTPA